jgi:uncharacterized protein
MHARTTYPVGVPCWVDTMQPDPEAAKEFYGELFGWTFENRAPADAPGPYYAAKRHGLDVAAIGGPTDGATAPSWNTYTAVADADQTTERVRAAGGTVLTEPTVIPEAGRLATFADAQGAVFSAWEAGAFIGAQLVNEPGSWNFSELHTRATADAARFYRDVFGWDVLSFGMGDTQYTFFTLDGYGDFLAHDNPAVRENQEASGAPGGFADAVAWLIDSSSEPEATPAHWSVTFAVDDADGAAATADRLGGKVLVPPFDAEPVRMTILSDPQGAIFCASKYQPS